MQTRVLLFVALAGLVVRLYLGDTELSQADSSLTTPPAFYPIASSLAEYRPLNGTGNNIANPTWGAVGSLYQRGYAQNPFGNSYQDGIGVPPVGPGARVVSNQIIASGPNVLSTHPISLLQMIYGQFINHDLMRTDTNASDPLAIVVPDNDPDLPVNTTMPFARSKFVPDPVTGVYGSDAATLAAVRAGTTCYLKADTSNPSFGPMLPKNTDGIGMENPSKYVNASALFIAGDIRANENPGLTVVHLTYMREHNRLCGVLAAANPTWDDEKLFQEARKWNVAFIQNVFFSEYMPATIGQTLPPYTAYKATVNPTIDLFFESTGFRYGHSEVLEYLPRFDINRNVIPAGNISLIDCFWNPTCWEAQGPEPLIVGLTSVRKAQVDVYYANVIRNFLFGSPSNNRGSAIDLASRNIQRARDHGIPFYNDMREYLGLPRASSFSDVTSNVSLAALLAQVYNNDINTLDTYVGGLAEDHKGFKYLGDLMGTSVLQQYSRLRDGDRFYFENTAASGFSAAELAQIKSTSLADIFVRNFPGITKIQCSVFFTSDTRDCGPQADKSVVNSSQIVGLNGRLNVTWAIDTQQETVNFTLSGRTGGWVGVGIAQPGQTVNKMLQADAYIGWVLPDGTAYVGDYRIGSQRSPNCTLQTSLGVCLDTAQGGQNNVLNPSGTEAFGITTLKFARKWNTGDSKDYPVVSGPTVLIYAMGETDYLSYHLEDKSFTTVDLLGGSLVPYEEPPVQTSPSCAIDPATFEHKVSLLEDRYLLYWNLREADGLLEVGIDADWQGWVGFGIQAPGDNPSKMRGSEAVIGWFDELGSQVNSYFLKGRDPSLIVPYDDVIPLTHETACRDERQHTIMFFTRNIADGNNTISLDAATGIVYAMGHFTGPRRLAKHGATDRAAGTINFSDGQQTGDFPIVPIIHALLMLLSWGLLLQVGAMLARHAKERPNACWFKSHRIFQIIGIILALAGFALAIVTVNLTGDGHFSGTHMRLGLALTILGVIQVVFAFVRPKPSESDEAKSKLRVVWEWQHHVVGKGSLLLAFGVLYTGLLAIEAPPSWFIAYYIIMGLVLATHIALELRTRLNKGHESTAYSQLMDQARSKDDSGIYDD